jgi:hypothetical protein
VSEGGKEGKEQRTRDSLLFGRADDLRTDTNQGYGIPHVITPNFDRLAREGTTFLHAYAQQSVCAPSRSSFMTGRRPDRIKAWNFENVSREGVRERERERERETETETERERETKRDRERQRETERETESVHAWGRKRRRKFADIGHLFTSTFESPGLENSG